MSQNKTLLVTGSGGFIGQRFIEYTLQMNEYRVVRLIRHENQYHENSSISWKQYQQGSTNEFLAVVHFAGLAHQTIKSDHSSIEQFRIANRDFTLDIANVAAKNGVKRFIFISSIGVNGNVNSAPFTERDDPNPHDDYAISKYEAEQGLIDISKNTGMEVVIIRPPLVYSPNSPGNFGSLTRWVNKVIPLPLGAIHNQKSFIALDNLVNFIFYCIDHPKAANEIFLITDGEDVSTTQLLQKVAKAYDKSPRLIPVPVSWMNFAAKLFGKEEVARRLFGNLQINSSKARNLLGWRPVVTMDEQLAKMATSKNLN